MVKLEYITPLFILKVTSGLFVGIEEKSVKLVTFRHMYLYAGLTSSIVLTKFKDSISNNKIK
uniref:Uncharacterized protein n=1 Tax=Strongyloides papillosus TaxID=174720 RepID=A0A0N5C836_STREA